MELLCATLNAVKLRSKRFYMDQYGHLSTLHYKARNFMLAILDAEKPLRTLFHLFFPIPWKFRVPNDTPEPAAFLADSDLCVRRLCAQQVPYLRTTRLFQFRDTPLRSLYRLYEQICAEETFEMTYEPSTSTIANRTGVWRKSLIPKTPIHFDKLYSPL
ncbi:hypothetical protein A0H81_08389 [Grifola frondosa]|uniref:Uncharacterized protein n=1 Tax=Grifola frondosa TaxID=5627 RepID=A0A1C7M498_GRIFR|nr:hypothetical protein A0H81_08389 [Grifola frondosa]